MQPSGLVYRLEGCVADLSDMAVEEGSLGAVSAVYVPLRAAGSTEPAHMVLRTEDRDVLDWARGRTNVRSEDAIARWVGPRTFDAVEAGPIGRPKGISESDVARALQGEAPRFVVLDENGTLFGWWAFAAILGGATAMCAVIVILVIRSIRRRKSTTSDGERIAAP